MSSYDDERVANNKIAVRWTFSSIAALCLIITASMIGCPQYDVYQQRKKGEAELERAKSSKLILIEEANARRESSQAYADAEIIRAHGLDSANRIIGQGLRENEVYLRYLYINNLGEINANGGSIIYVPTEAGLPILEAGRIQQQAQKLAAMHEKE